MRATRCPGNAGPAARPRGTAGARGVNASASASRSSMSTRAAFTCSCALMSGVNCVSPVASSVVAPEVAVKRSRFRWALESEESAGDLDLPAAAGDGNVSQRDRSHRHHLDTASARGRRVGVGAGYREREGQRQFDTTVRQDDVGVFDTARQQGPEAGGQSNIGEGDASRIANPDVAQSDGRSRKEPRRCAADRHRLAEPRGGLALERRAYAVAAEEPVDAAGGHRASGGDDQGGDQDETAHGNARKCSASHASCERCRDRRLLSCDRVAGRGRRPGARAAMGRRCRRRGAVRRGDPNDPTRVVGFDVDVAALLARAWAASALHPGRASRASMRRRRVATSTSG